MASDNYLSAASYTQTLRGRDVCSHYHYQRRKTKKKRNNRKFMKVHPSRPEIFKLSFETCRNLCRRWWHTPKRLAAKPTLSTCSSRAALFRPSQLARAHKCCVISCQNGSQSARCSYHMCGRSCRAVHSLSWHR